MRKVNAAMRMPLAKTAHTPPSVDPSERASYERIQRRRLHQETIVAHVGVQQVDALATGEGVDQFLGVRQGAEPVGARGGHGRRPGELGQRRLDTAPASAQLARHSVVVRLHGAPQARAQLGLRAARVVVDHSHIAEFHVRALPVGGVSHGKREPDGRPSLG
jgi:hypothetical protein